MNLAQFERNGFLILKNALNEETIIRLITALFHLKPAETSSQKSQTLYGVRNLLNLSSTMRCFSQSKVVKRITENILGENSKVVRAIYFDKNADANWKVPWHQDLTIAVREKRQIEGFSAWTIKAGIQHVQPPTEILEKMITLRFHLDDTDETNGALKVIPKSHLKGRLNAIQIKAEREKNKIQICRARRGDCLIMRPLLLHSSSAAINPQNRRVVHLEFSADSLPGNLEWDES